MKKRKRSGRSVQELMGIRCFTRYGLETDQGELLFFQVSPTNISVLSYINIELKIRSLQAVVTIMPEIEIICTDSCECFDANKAYLRQREKEETNPKLQSLLRQDAQMLTQLQSEMSTARQFVFVRRCLGLKPDQVFTLANETQKRLAEEGFEVQRMKKADIKRFLAIYFGTSMDGGQLPDTDGAQYFQEVTNG